MAKAPFHTQLLTVESSDSTPSLLFVGADSRRYLFNAPESVSRVCIQSKLPMKKIERVFLGDLSRSAGLPGLILSICEGGGRDVRIHGPPGSLHLVAACRFFTRRDQMSIDVQEHPPVASSSKLPVEPIHQDSNVSIHAFVLSPAETDRPLRGIKRKRSQSPIGANGRQNRRSPGPSAFEGEAADEWRRKVVADMFKASERSENADTLSRFESARRNGPSPAYLAQRLPQYSGTTNETICYIARTPEQRGKFLPQKAKEKGVRPGQAFKKLTEGERVWVPKIDLPKPNPDAANLSKAERQREAKGLQELLKSIEAKVVPGEGEGHWVTPEECLEPPLPGKAFMVLNVPTTEHLTSLLSRASASGEMQSTGLAHVHYFLGPGVLHDPRLAEFASSFDKTVRHHVCSPDLPHNNSVTFTPAALLNLRLSLMDPVLFRPPARTISSDVPSPTFQGWPELTAASTRDDRFTMGSSLEQAKTASSFDFAVPSEAADRAAAQLKSLNRPPELLAKAKEVWSQYVADAKEINARIAAMPAVHNDDEYVVTPLGTGSAIPSKYRNVSSTLLHLPREKGYVLLDAGEGTLGQLRRHFGLSESARILRSLKLISISHMHQDHHAGLASILRARKEAVSADVSETTASPLVVVAPIGAQLYISELHDLFDLGLFDASGTAQVVFIDAQRLEPQRRLDELDPASKALERLYAETGIEKVTTVPVLHRCRCWGIVIAHSIAGKAVFSGDTMPCDALVEHGQGASLLIHEATIEDSMPEVAEAKGHSTFGQAIDIGRRMKARHILLTHFSARYPKVPPLEEQAQKDGDEPASSKVAISFDMCTLRMSDWDKMKELQKGMNALFSLDE